MAAGKGSRLGDVTNDRPKCFLEIKGIKLIEYNIALLHANGIKDIVIVTGYMHKKIEELLRNIEGITFVYNPFYEFMNVLGSFFMACNTIKNDEDLIYMHADTLCAPEIFNEMFLAEGDMVLPVEFKSCDEEAMKVKTQNGKLVEISKQISCREGEGEFIGIAKISKEIILSLKTVTTKLMEQKVFNAYFEGAITELITEQKYNFEVLDTTDYFWGEIDFLEDYITVEQSIPQNLVDIAIRDRKEEKYFGKQTRR